MALFNVKKLEFIEKVVKGFLVSNTSWSVYNFRMPLIHFLKQRDIKIETISSKDNFSNKLIENHNLLPSPYSLNPFSEFICLLRLSNFLIKRDFDFFIVYTIRSSIEILLVNIFLKKSVFITINGLGILKRSKSKLLRKLLLKFIKTLFRSRYLKKVFFQTHEDRNFFLEMKIISKEKTIVVNGTGIDLDFFKPIKISTKKPIKFLHFSRLIKSKGVLEFCDAAHFFLNNSEAVFYLAGDYALSDPEGIKQEIIEEYEKDKSIEFLGFSNDIKSLLRKVDCVILQSSYPEGIPKSLLEAIAAGKIIIASDQPGCRKTVKVDYNGFITESLSTKSLIHQIKKVLDKNVEELNVMKKNSITLAKENFNIKEINQKYIEEILKDE